MVNELHLGEKIIIDAPKGRTRKVVVLKVGDEYKVNLIDGLNNKEEIIFVTKKIDELAQGIATELAKKQMAEIGGTEFRIGMELKEMVVANFQENNLSKEQRAKEANYIVAKKFLDDLSPSEWTDAKYEELKDTYLSRVTKESWDRYIKENPKILDECKSNNLSISDETKEEVVSLLRQKKYGQASEILVEQIKDNLHIYTIQDDKSNEMWIYDNGIYVPNGRSIIREFLRGVMGDEYNMWLVNQVIAKIDADTQIKPDKFFLQNNPEEIPVKNGILNIITRDLSPFNPKKIFFSKIQAEYDADATCPMIDKFLDSTLFTFEDTNVFKEIGGFCLMTEYKFEKAFMFVGNGRNGKDKSLELIKRLLGVENCCGIPLSAMKTDDFIISEFFGKMANIAGDIDNRDLKDTSTFKALTGRSMVSAKRKFLNAISFVNYAKFIFACNELPMVYDVSKGFWDRWVLLEFPYTFVTQPEYDSADEKKNLKIRDEDIIEKITTDDEMSGFLNSCLNGLQRLIENKGFSTARGSDDVKNLWIRKSNSVMAFCFSNIEEDYEGYISKKDFRKKYAAYCKEHKVPSKSDYVIKRTLEEMFGTGEGRKDIIGSGWEHIWEGIKWKN